MRRFKSILFVLVVAVLSLLLVPAVIAQGGANVDVIDNEFVPSSVTIQAGETVTWSRQEGFHNVRADDGSWGNTPGDDWTTFEHTFTTAGTYEYYCEVHSEPDDTDMNGVVIVEAPTAVTLSGLSSRAGSYYVLWALGAALLGIGALAGRRLVRR